MVIARSKRRSSPEAGLHLEPLAYRIRDFAAVAGISRASVYKLIKERKLKTIVVAGRRLVPRSEAERLLSDAA